MFRIELRNLFARLKSGEIPGAKFTFNEATAGYIRERIEDLAEEDDPSERAEIATEITSMATLLGSIHPISLSFMIQAVTGGSWHSSAFEEVRSRTRGLEEAGLVEVRTKTGRFKSSGKSYYLLFTERGASLMRSIGFSDDEINEANEIAMKPSD